MADDQDLYIPVLPVVIGKDQTYKNRNDHIMQRAVFIMKNSEKERRNNNSQQRAFENNSKPGL